MSREYTLILVAAAFVGACARGPDGHTLAELRTLEPDVKEVRVEDSLDQAMLGYRQFLEEAPESALTPEAMRRLADLKLEKQYGILGDGVPAAPDPAVVAPVPEAPALRREAAPPAPAPGRLEFPVDVGLAWSPADSSTPLAGAEGAGEAGALEAIALYERILSTYPDYAHGDQVLYQTARAYDELGRTEEAIAVLERLIAEHPDSRHIDEAQFRRAEYLFTRKRHAEAGEAYTAIAETGAGSEYYELALYKLGWTYYKQELHEEAVDQYVALLDHKVASGYDFDQKDDEETERRIADTYRVISLSFSNLGGPGAVGEYFAAKGQRSYEDRIYSQLGEFYLEKLRYEDAASAYRTFVALRPLHRAAPHFSMRIVEIYEAGGFPRLVLEAKKDFAGTYGLRSEYWRHFPVEDAPEVVDYLKSNLVDLAGHYHALYQRAEQEGEKPENFREATRWYRGYLASFPADPGSPGVNQRLADLLLEHGDFGEAAREYERTAYEYAEHDAAAAAGYAAIYSHRQRQKRATGAEQEAARSEAVASTLRFVERFPQHEHAAAVLAAAARDLYEMRLFERALATARQLIESYPQTDESIRRSAWTVVAHSAFELADYGQAESGYARVVEMTPPEDDSRAALVDNLAAAIYKQAEQANLAGESRSAADHFLRIGHAAPGSAIEAAAEYDAAAALIRVEDWDAAAGVLESFRAAHPEHALFREATRQLAFVYRSAGDLARAAEEYERVAAESVEEALRAEALLVAGELYEQTGAAERALVVYERYVSEFPQPLEPAAETRFKLAEIHRAARDEARCHEQLREIVALERAAGGDSTPRIRVLAARSALVLAEALYQQFGEIALVEPFEQNVQEKQRRLSAALDAFAALVGYEVAEVTAAATFYMADLYLDFGRALRAAQPPAELDPAELEAFAAALAEEAQPLEEKAIEIHRKNLELLGSGIHNPWIDKSLARLAELMPARYAKSEASAGFLDSIETYTYRAPGGRDAVPH